MMQHRRKLEHTFKMRHPMFKEYQERVRSMKSRSEKYTEASPIGFVFEWMRKPIFWIVFLAIGAIVYAAGYVFLWKLAQLFFE